MNAKPPGFGNFTPYGRLPPTPPWRRLHLVSALDFIYASSFDLWISMLQASLSLLRDLGRYWPGCGSDTCCECCVSRRSAAPSIVQMDPSYYISDRTIAAVHYPPPWPKLCKRHTRPGLSGLAYSEPSGPRPPLHSPLAPLRPYPSPSGQVGKNAGCMLHCRPSAAHASWPVAAAALNSRHCSLSTCKPHGNLPTSCRRRPPVKSGERSH